MRKGWEYKSFETCINKLPKAKQVKTSEYSSGTKYPIISQEDKLISGYYDDESYVFHIDSPVVIFGDHTRVLKYIDFDFVVGADGVKIISPQKDLNAKFLLYYLQWYKIPNLGYSRHYKLLREIKIPLPPQSTQLAIVSELDKINELIRLKKEQLKDFDNLAQSLFYEMFGDPVENEKGWEVSSVENVCSSIVRGPFGSALKKEFFVEPNSNTYKVYEQKHAIQKDAKIGSYYVTEEKFKELSRFEVKSGDIIMSCSGTIGELFIIPPNAEKGLMNQALLKFTLNNQIYKRFFLFLMDCVKKDFTVRGTGLQNIGSVKIIKAMTFGLPPLSLQRLFAQRIEQIEREKSEVQKSIQDLETLLASRMQYWFE